MFLWSILNLQLLSIPRWQISLSLYKEGHPGNLPFLQQRRARMKVGNSHSQCIISHKWPLSLLIFSHLCWWLADEVTELVIADAKPWMIVLKLVCSSQKLVFVRKEDLLCVKHFSLNCDLQRKVLLYFLRIILYPLWRECSYM